MPGMDAGWEVRAQIAKVDDDRRLAFGWASIAVDGEGRPVVDHQGDYIPVPELERAAYDYVAKSRDASEMHGRRGVATLVESVMMTPEKYAAMGMPQGPIGWWVGFKVHDDDVWRRVKSGDYREFSIGGSGTRKAVRIEGANHAA
jgi:hypothetical protein